MTPGTPHVTHAGRSTLLACVALAFCAGCLERRFVITSEPPGATVTLNDVEVGRTPLEAGFTYYGTYDVRVEKDGYAVLRTRARARTPIYESPPLDLVATALPADVETVVKWHFVLQPLTGSGAGQTTADPAVLDRAKALRSSLTPEGPK